MFFDDAPVATKTQPVNNDFEDLLEPQSSVEPETSKPTTSGIELPQRDVEVPVPEPQSTEAPSPELPDDVNLLKGTCSNCSLQFQVPMPIGVMEAIVVCPSCSSEQLFQR